MKQLTFLGLLTFLVGVWTPPSDAQELVEGYRARLGQRDHFNSSGQRLTTPSAIIRQDRANFHRFATRDPEDEGDRFFSDPKKRDILERLLQRGRADPDTVAAIINSTPLVQVEVWRDGRGPFIVVTTLPEPGQKSSTASTEPSVSQEARTGSGSGFFVSTDGHIITNEHVVGGCARISVVGADRHNSSARVVAASKRDDLALLKIEAKPAPVIAFPKSARVQQGATVIAYGFPLAPLLASSGSVSTGYVTALAGIGDNPRQLQISAPIQQGNSGGPLVDSKGVLVGVIVSKLDALAVAGFTGDIPQNVNFAIKASAVLDLLDAHNVNYRREDMQNNLSVEEVTHQLRASTVKVECN